MDDFALSLDQSAAKATQARADFALSVLQLRERLRPSALVKDAAHSMQSAVAPVMDPLAAQAKSASGVLAIGSVAAALLFGLGRASRSPTDEHFRSATENSGEFIAPAYRDPRPGPGAGSIVKTLLLSGAAIAAGSVLATRFPVTEAEKRFSDSTGRDIKRWAQQHSGEIIGGAVNSLGLAKGLGGLLAFVAMAGVAGKRTTNSAD